MKLTCRRQWERRLTTAEDSTAGSAPAHRAVAELAADHAHVRERGSGPTEEGRRRAAGFIGSGLRDGSLAPAIAETFDGLERIADAHRLMESNTHLGKIVVRVEH
ncbi:zinc-binding dehydrogenase [Streptomyces sp. NK15101]|uniref:zinc-binding dehydrogenase n=1 Tax=Streptomyces sp. NK15101 TaxID=2873261 RepID=UPI001CEC5E86|nr:zinc-binding dehydrogenase [Streptomyces sp. NK15101]